MAHSTEAAEYTDFISAEREKTTLVDMTLKIWW